MPVGVLQAAVAEKGRLAAGDVGGAGRNSDRLGRGVAPTDISREEELSPVARGEETAQPPNELRLLRGARAVLGGGRKADFRKGDRAPPGGIEEPFPIRLERVRRAVNEGLLALEGRIQIEEDGTLLVELRRDL